MHGSANLIQTLLRNNLVDEFRLWVFPLVIGSGKRLFAEGTIAGGVEAPRQQGLHHRSGDGDVRASRRGHHGIVRAGMSCRQVRTHAEPSRRRVFRMSADSRPERAAWTNRVGEYLITRTVLGRRAILLADALRHRVVPNHWSNMFGIVSMACFAVLLVTGIYLMFFYTPASTVVEYDGSYLPLRGIEVSSAFNSTLNISFDVRAGLLMRQAHHWAGLLLPASLIMQLLTTFFTGGFRNPRRGSWVLLFLIFIVALIGGWSGYALPDDMLSGTGLRIVEGIVLAIPIVGTWASSALFGGEFPGEVIAHLYPIHVVVVPILLILLLTRPNCDRVRATPAAVARPWPLRGERRRDTGRCRPRPCERADCCSSWRASCFSSPRRSPSAQSGCTGHPRRGTHPPAVSRTGTPASSTGHCDWCLPGWEFVWLGRTWTLAVLVPLALVTVFLALVLAYPFIEGWITGDHRDHHLLDRPRNAPTRTAIGVAGIAFYGVLWGAAGLGPGRHAPWSEPGIRRHGPAGSPGVRAGDRLSLLPAGFAWRCRPRTANWSCTEWKPDESCGCPAESSSRSTGRWTTTSGGDWSMSPSTRLWCCDRMRAAECGGRAGCACSCPGFSSRIGSTRPRPRYSRRQTSLLTEAFRLAPSGYQIRSTVMNSREQQMSTSVLVVGAGGSGLRTAIELAELGIDVLVVGKRSRNDAHTALAAGGINAALGTMDPDDSWQQHAADTILESYYLANPEIVATVAMGAAEGIRDLERYGMRFAREEDGRISQRFFGAHTFRRTAFSGDYTGLEIQRTLVRRAAELDIRILDGIYVTRILVDDGRVFGAYGFGLVDGTRYLIHADAVVLATGGHTRIWRHTSSRPDENTGDSFRLAVRAGARIRDPELVQFHPSGILEPEAAAGTLVSEAARGEGGCSRTVSVSGSWRSTTPNAWNCPPGIAWRSPPSPRSSKVAAPRTAGSGWMSRTCLGRRSCSASPGLQNNDRTADARHHHDSDRGSPDSALLDGGRLGARRRPQHRCRRALRGR